MSVLENARKPVGSEGEAILTRMNRSHTPLSEWAFEHLEVKPTDVSLDIGCGGGANVRRLLAKSPEGHVTGVDYSEVSVRKSTEENEQAVKDGKCTILQADVAQLPFEDNTFDVVTAFETIYFWPDVARSLAQVYRVLKPGGCFLVVNEANGSSDRDANTLKEIPGMKFYSAAQLTQLLETAGFDNVRTYETEQGWVCALGTKE